MAGTRVAYRYAKSLISAATQKGQLDSVAVDVESLGQALSTDAAFYDLVKSPIVESAQKMNLITSRFGEKLEPLTMRFLTLTCEKHRENYLPEILKSFAIQFDEINRVARAKLVTAVEATEEILKKVESFVLETGGYKTVHIEKEINPDILGGFVLRFGDRLYDDSISSRMRELRAEFNKNSYVKKFRH